MKKVIAKKKSAVVKTEPVVSKKAASLSVKYNLFLGGATVFLSLVIFFIIFTSFVNNLAALYILRDSSFKNYADRDVSMARFEKSLSLIQANLNKSISLDNPLLWQESELMTLPDGVDSMSNLNFLSSPDGSRFAYISTTENNKSSISLDGEIGEAYDQILFMTFSPDSQHFAYGVKVGFNEAVVIDGVIGKPYDFIFPPYFFTPDSGHFVYKARTAEGDLLVFDDKPGTVYEQIYNQFMSDDGENIIYYAKRGDTIYKNVLSLVK